MTTKQIEKQVRSLRHQLRLTIVKEENASTIRAAWGWGAYADRLTRRLREAEALLVR